MHIKPLQYSISVMCIMWLSITSISNTPEQIRDLLNKIANCQKKYSAKTEVTNKD